MNISIKYDVSFICKTVLQEQLELSGIDYEIIGLNDVEIRQHLSEERLNELESKFRSYGIEIIHNQKVALVQKIKDLITDMIWKDDNLPNITTSAYLVEQLNHSYGYLSNLFSEMTYTSIENYIILQKIERAKQMITSENYTLTEIAFQLNYSSVAHLSTQFKKTTGLSPSAFQRILKLRKENSNIIP
ncbi:MAG: AraC family transcriptional regulator [Chitinophagales bacterium]